MLIPLRSGRTWRRIEPQPALTKGVNRTFKVEDEDDTPTVGYFKYLKPTSPHSSMYSFGAERVSVRLGIDLGLPIREAYLETIDGHAGIVSLEAPGVAWFDFDQTLLPQVTFVNEHLWPTCIVFDVWVANIDRHAQNIFIESDPPQRRPEHGDACATWLIDHGHSCLWPLWKWDGVSATDTVDSIDPDTLALRTEHAQRLRNHMPAEYRMAFPLRFDQRRKQAIDAISRISDHQIEGLVAEIPVEYMSTRAAESTVRLLKARRDVIDSLVTGVFPT